MNCGPHHILAKNYDMTFRIDDSGSLTYRSNATFYLCDSNRVGNLLGENITRQLLLPGNIDQQQRENRSVVTNCQTLEIRASSCHGYLPMLDEGGEDAEDEAATENDQASAEDESVASRYNAFTTASVLALTLWCVL
jgi:hypothetical protein